MKKSKKVFLRKIKESDINKNYIQKFQEEKVFHFLDTDVKNFTKKIVIDYIKHGEKTKEYFMYAVCDSENKKHIGNVKIGSINYRDMTSDLVTVIFDKTYWGKGIATEAIILGNEIAFDQYNIRKLCGGMYDNNIGSIKAYMKAGWIIEGVLPNHYIHHGKLRHRVCVSCYNPKFKLNNE